MSIEVESQDGEAVLVFWKPAADKHVALTLTLFGDGSAPPLTTAGLVFPIRDLLIALHALSGTPTPEPAKPVRPKFRDVSGWFGRRKD